MNYAFVESTPALWRSAPLWTIATRQERRGEPGAERLSVYRDHGVVPTASRDDNFNKPGEDLATYKVVHPGNLVLNKMKTWQGSLAVSDHYGIVSPAYYVLDLHTGVHPRWLHHLLRSQPYIALYAALSKGIRPNQWDLPFDEFRQIPVLLPPLDEQRRIADFLDAETARIDGLTSLRHRQLVMLGIRSTSVAERLVLDARATWPTAPLKYLVREIDNRDGPLGELLSVSIHHGVVPRSSTTSDEPRADDLSNYKRVRADDLVLNRMRAFQGGVGVAPMSGIVSPDYTVMRATGRVRPRYLHYIFRSPWFVGQMAARLRGIGSSDQGNVRTPRVAFADLGSIYVPTPGPSAQDELIGTLDDEVVRMQALISVIERQQHLLDERRQALITAAVTGQLDVTTARGGHS